MNFEEAVRLLDRIAPGEHLWKRHSHQVAEVAYRIATCLAQRGEDMDPEWMRINGLLHDIGRSKTHGPVHGWVGYVILKNRGLEKYARGCIVHWLKGRTQEEVLADGILSARFVRKVYQEFGLPHLSLTDKILALADSLVMHDRVVDLETRYADIRKRYGSGPWVERHYHFSRSYHDEIEEKIGRSLPDLLSPIMGPRHGDL